MNINTKAIRFISQVMLASFFFINMQGWQNISAAGLHDETDITQNDGAADRIIKGPCNPLLEHALADYRHYYKQKSSQDYSDCCLLDCQKYFDFAANPFFEYSRIEQSNQSIFSYGCFVGLQFNLNRFWIRAYDVLGQVAEEQDLQTIEKITGATVVEPDKKTIASFKEHTSRKATGADDVIIKIGYDFCRDNEKHFGLYLLGGFPTNRNLPAKIIGLNEVDLALFIDSPAMGGKNFSIGGGMTGAYTLYDHKEDHVALLFDMQYSYAIPTVYTKDLLFEGKVVHAVTKFKPLGSDNWSVRPRLIENIPGYKTVNAYVKATSGNLIAGWSALHLAHKICNIELGSTFRINFAPKTELCTEDGDKFRDMLNWNVPSTVFALQPYAAVSGCATLGNCPFEAGIGIAYEYDRLSNEIKLSMLEQKINGFQGLVLWGSLAVSF